MKQTISIKSKLHSADLENKRVFLRADFNIPIAHGKMIDDYRLERIIPTLNLIFKKKGKIILGTHLGRPQGNNPSLSAKMLLPWFKKHEYKVEFEPDLASAYEKSFHNPDVILLLENLRFFPGERSDDQEFARTLAQIGDYYVNDAFGLVHRTDCSITKVPQIFESNKKTIGLLIEKELHMLNKLLEKPKSPFVLIIGGAKISSKLPFIKSLVTQVDAILLCPAIVFTFLKALGKPVGNSLVDDELLLASKEILETAQQNNTKIVFPLDYQIADQTFDGPVSYIESTDIPDNSFGVSIGRKTEELFAQEIMNAQTVFFNGSPGNEENEKTLEGSLAILSAMAGSDAVTVASGGNTTALVQKFGFTKELDFCSTGGGATLAYLAGEKLPGLEPFLKERT